MLVTSSENALRFLPQLWDSNVVKIGEIEIEERESKKKVPVNLYQDKHPHSPRVFAILFNANRPFILGEINYQTITLLKHHSVHTIDTVNIPEEDRSYYVNKEIFNKCLFVKNFWCPGRLLFKYIGKRLFDLAKRVSASRECMGRIMLEAVNTSHGFYQKQKMRAMVGVKQMSSSQVDERIKQLSPHTQTIGQLLMYLPKKDILTQ